MLIAVRHTDPLSQKALRYERLNLVLVYGNSLLFSGLFTFDSVPVFLVRAVFNGSGIIMVAGLLSLLVGNLAAYFKTQTNGFAPLGMYYASIGLFILQTILALAFIIILLMK